MERACSQGAAHSSPVGGTPGPCGSAGPRQSRHSTVRQQHSQRLGLQALGQKRGSVLQRTLFSLGSQISNNTGARRVFKSRHLELTRSSGLIDSQGNDESSQPPASQQRRIGPLGFL